MSTVAHPVPSPPLSWRRIWTVVRKELRLGFQNRMTQLTVGIVTLIFILMPLAMAYGMGDNGLLQQMSAGQPIDPQQVAIVRQVFPQLADLSPDTLIQALLLSSMQALFLIIPLMIPLIIAVYSVIGEKQTRSLEAVLATPIETRELLLAKCLAAAAPGVLSGWVSYLIFALLAIPALPAPVLRAVVFNPAWLLALLLIAPAASFLAVIVGLMVSSRATDPQSAQQVAGIIVLPVVVLVIGQIAGLVQLSILLVLGATVVLAAVDIGLLAAAVRLFQRETILTRWK